MTTGEATLGRAATGPGAARRPAIHQAGRVLGTALAGGALASFAGRAVVSRSFGGLVQLAAGALGWTTGGAVPAIAEPICSAGWTHCRPPA